MEQLRRIARSALMLAALGYMLALGQMAHARLQGDHAAHAAAKAAWGVLCLDKGAIPTDDAGGRPGPHDCPDCALCLAKAGKAGPPPASFVHAAPDGSRTSRIPAAADAAVGPRAPPDVSARGPPILS